MSANTRYLFKGTVANGATKYVGVPINNDGSVNAQIAWLDATSAATITLELTNYDSDDAPLTAAAAHKWKASALAITGPNATGAGSSLVSANGIYQKRGRLKIVATANCSFEVIG